MAYNALVNLRFTKQTGAVDMANNTWTSEKVTTNTTGKFTGTCADFNGTSSVLTKTNGSRVIINKDEDFTISFWIRLKRYSDGRTKEFVFSDGNINTPSTLDAVYLNHINNAYSITIKDSNEHELTSNTIEIPFDIWQWVVITRYKNQTGIFLNGKLISSISTGIKEFNFDGTRMSIGFGKDEGNLPRYFLGALDDITVLTDSLARETDNINADLTIPNTYLSEFIDPNSQEDADGWVDKEPEYSRYDEIVKLTELKRLNTKSNINNFQIGVIPYIIYPAYWFDNPYFENGQLTGIPGRNSDTRIIHISGFKNNQLFTNIPDKRFFSESMYNAFEKKWLSPFLLFINNKFIPWSKIKVIRSDKYFTLILSKFTILYENIQSIKLIVLPRDIEYSEERFIHNTKLQFSFNEKGLLDNNGNIRIGINDAHTRIVYYRNQKCDRLKLNIGLDHKITENNIIVFNEDGTLNTSVAKKIESGNMFSIVDNTNTALKDKFTIVCTFYETQDQNEDYISKFRNQILARQFAAEDKINITAPELDLDLLREEFDFSHAIDTTYITNINNSIDYVFGYDKNKYDKIFEDIRPVNIIEYSAQHILNLKDPKGFVTMSRDIYDKSDNHNETYVLIFEDGIIPQYYQDIEYHMDTFRFEPYSLKPTSTFEIVYFRNVRNELIPLNESNKSKDGFLKNVTTYIPRDEMLILTDKRGVSNLCPILYDFNETTDTVSLHNTDYLKTNLYLGSTHQFQYAYIDSIYEETNIIPIPYSFRACYNPDRYLLFINGHLLNNSLYKVVIPSLTDSRIKFKAIYTLKKVDKTDRIEMVYLGASGNIARGLFNGDMQIKILTTYCIKDRQSTFAVPLPYKDYDLSSKDYMMVLKHSLYVNQEEYDLYKEDDVWYITFFDEDDEMIVGEAVTFVFPFYALNTNITDYPSSGNTMQFITRKTTTTSETNAITFPADSLGNIESMQSILLFKDNSLINQTSYSLSSPNTIQLDKSVPAGTTFYLISESDKYNLQNNNIGLTYTIINITQKGQDAITLPFKEKQDSYIIFRNGKIMNHSIYTIVDNTLLIEHKYNDLRNGDVLTIICSNDSSTSSNNINYYYFTIDMIFKDSIDIPNFNGITYNANNIILFINGEIIFKDQYTITGNTINLNKSYTIGSEAIIYLAYKTLNPMTVAYKQANTIDPNSNILFEPVDVIVTEGGEPNTNPTIRVTIIQSEHQTIRVTVNGVEYTESFISKIGNRYDVSVTAEEAYNPGILKITPNSPDNTFLADTTISASTVSIKTFDINITQSDHQRLTVVIGDKKYTGTETIHNVPYGTKYTVKLESTEDKYAEGEIKIEEIR